MALKQTSSSVNIVKFGPVGSFHYDYDKYRWDDQMGGGGICALVQIFISFNSDGICSLQFQYLKNGKHVLSEKHGGGSDSRYRAICFDYPREYLTSIYGSYTLDRIVSITFATNLTTYGPFGNSDLKCRSLELKLGNPSQFYGFFGTADSSYIRSIGLYINPFSSLREVDSGSHGFSRENFELPGITENDYSDGNSNASSAI